MQNAQRDQMIALAGALQAIYLVDQLAKTGYLRTDEFATAIDSLFNTHPENTESVFNGLNHLQLGLEQLEKLLRFYRAAENGDPLRYLLGVMHIQKRLYRKRDMLTTIGSRLERAEQQAQHFSRSHDNVVANIADIYTDTISTFSHRIHVAGDPRYLQQQRLANQIRALLFAAIRAITLWRQVGGKRWQLVVQRRQLIKLCDEMIRESTYT